MEHCWAVWPTADGVKVEGGGVTVVAVVVTVVVMVGGVVMDKFRRSVFVF